MAIDVNRWMCASSLRYIKYCSCSSADALEFYLSGNEAQANLTTKIKELIDRSDVEKVLLCPTNVQQAINHKSSTLILSKRSSANCSRCFRIHCKRKFRRRVVWRWAMIKRITIIIVHRYCTAIHFSVCTVTFSVLSHTIHKFNSCNALHLSYFDTLHWVMQCNAL